MFRLIAALIVTVLPVLATPGNTDRGFEAHPMDILDNNGDPGNMTRGSDRFGTPSSQ